MSTILDCRDFDLQLPGARELLDELSSTWYMRNEIIVQVFKRNGINPATLVWTEAMETVWLKVLQRVAKRGALHRLMDTLIADTNTPALQDVLDALPQFALDVDAPLLSAGQNPFDGRLLAQRRPFLDRNLVREALADLASTGGARVLVVNGPAGSGRSHIWFLVSHGCSRLGLTANAAVRIQPSSTALGGEAWSPLDLMNEIADGMEWPRPVFDPQAQPDTHLRLLARWFRTNATTKVDSPRWLVIDDVSNVYMTDACQRMAAEIANAAATEQAGALRVVLLGFNGAFAVDADQVVTRQSIVYLDAEALKAYFKELAASVGEELRNDALEILFSQAAGRPPYSVPLPFVTIGAGIGRIADRYLQTVGAR
jgi:hypothetical protein